MFSCLKVTMSGKEKRREGCVTSWAAGHGLLDNTEGAAKE
jgi:hypothetical protein